MICSNDRHIGRRPDVRIAIILVFAGFLVLIGLSHVSMTVKGDDARNLESLKAARIPALIRERFFSVNGKFLTDGAALLCCKLPFAVWKIMDTAVYGVILYLIWDLFSDKSLISLAVSAACILLFPLKAYMGSAGYMATSANYLYTLLAMLLCMKPVIEKFCHRKVTIFSVILSLFGMIYAENQDQYAVAIIAGFLLILLYLTVNKDLQMQKSMIFITSVYLVLSVIVYILMLLVPGHIARMRDPSETLRWLPEYLEWTVGDKLYHGFSTCFANIYYNHVAVVILFYLLLSLYLCMANRKKCFLAIIPAFIILCMERVGGKAGMSFGKRNHVVPEISSWPFFVLAVCILLLTIGAVFWGIKDKTLAFKIALLMTIGYGSRVMMGFSGTIYASALRTFTLQLFTFIVSDILLAEKIIQTGQHKNESELPY